MVKFCENCKGEIPLQKNTSYEGKKYQARRFCSKECHNKSMIKESYVYFCDCCGAEIISKKKKTTTKVFCDNACKGKYNRTLKRKSPSKKGERVTKKCEQCGLIYDVIYSRREKSKFCSMSCRAKYKNSVIKKKGFYKPCDYCGKLHYRLQSDIKNQINLFCSRECMGKYYKQNECFKGDKSGTWGGGKIEGRGKDWNVKREVARERDSYTCTRCGVLEENHKSYQLSVHHIVPFKFFKDTEKANEPTNLLTLCEVCHRKIHTGENHPSKFKNTFSEVIG